MTGEFTFQRFLAVIVKYLRLFIIVGVLAVILGAVLSAPSFMPPRYRSTAIVYPVNLNSYSIETRTDQLLQLLRQLGLWCQLAPLGCLLHPPHWLR